MRRLAPLVLLAVLVAGCGKSSSPTSSTPTSVSTAASTASTTTQAVPATTLVRVYFLRNGKIGPVGRSLPTTRAVALAALEQLFDGPTPTDRTDGFTSAIPASASPAAVTLVDGTALVDLPDLSHAALAEVVYTLTQFPTVRGVRAVRTIGDTKPLTRADFEDVTPQILVEQPLPHQPVESPLRVRGTANTFEATFDVQLLDASGHKLLQDFVTATSGSGTRGTYDVSLKFPTGSEPRTLVVFEPSAENGQPLHIVRIPLG